MMTLLVNKRRVLSTALCTTAANSTRSMRSFSLPVVIRLTYGPTIGLISRELTRSTLKRYIRHAMMLSGDTATLSRISINASYTIGINLLLIRNPLS